MKVFDIQHNEYDLKLSSNPINRAIKREDRSEPHLKARQLLSERFSSYQILEEVPIKIDRQTQLYLDFFIPLRKLAVEVHGEQHYTYIHHFHGSKLNFFKQKKNDGAKMEWCEINGVQLVVFKWNEQDKWGEQLGR